MSKTVILPPEWADYLLTGETDGLGPNDIEDADAARDALTEDGWVVIDHEAGTNLYRVARINPPRLAG